MGSMKVLLDFLIILIIIAFYKREDACLRL